MIKKILISAAMLGSMVGGAQATSVILEGNYIKTAVSDDGTLGYGGTTSPGILYDVSGTGDFSSSDDYLTPGAPFEGFGVKVDGTLYQNTNNSSDAISTLSITDTSSGGDNSVSWVGKVAGLFTIAHDYFFGADGENIEVKTTITALTDITDLSFARGLDPDPDVDSFGSYNTVNGLGRDANSDGDFDDAGDTAISDWAHSEGTKTGLTIGLYSNSEYDHAAGIDAGWSIDPSTYLTLQDDGNGDYSIGMAFWLGVLTTGDSVTFDYAYVMGETLESVVVPGEVPVPAAFLMFAPALLGFFGLRRKASKAS